MSSEIIRFRSSFNGQARAEAALMLRGCSTAKTEAVFLQFDPNPPPQPGIAGNSWVCFGSSAS